MGDDNELGIVFIIALFIGFIVGYLVGGLEQCNTLEKTAIRLGVAEYYIDKNNEKTFHYFVEPKN
jgi:hypothetical protein